MAHCNTVDVIRESEYSVAFIKKIVPPYCLQKGRGLLQYSRGEGSGPEYSVAFIQNHGGRSRRGRSQVQVRGRTEEYGDDSFRGNSKFLFSFI